MLRSLARYGLPLLALVAALALYRGFAPSHSAANSPVPTERRLPLAIVPRHDLPEVASDAQLIAVLARVRPAVGEADTNYLIHALRLWGAEAAFDDAHLAGYEMLAYLLDDRSFADLAGPASPPLVNVSTRGPHVRRAVAGDPHATTGSVHTDDLLATLAEVGVPLDMPVYSRAGETHVGALLASALERYHARQQECEWTAIAFTRYALSNRPWTNAAGETIDVDVLVNDLIEHPLRDGVCGGTHRLEALAVLLAADEQAGVLSQRTRRRICGHLAGVVARLSATQDPQGFWTKDWAASPAARRHTQRSNDSGVPLAEQILATGHHLEWMALLPADLLPPRDVLVRAGQWLVRAMLEVDDATLRVEYGPFTHAARALCLWRGAEPWTVWQAAAGRGDEAPLTAQHDT